MSGIVLVTTPIGNIGDFTARAKEQLELANYIFCEDTRVFRQLAKFANIDISEKKINSFHDHSGDKQLMGIISLARTQLCCFVSDAGSPLISDPAFPLVKMAIEQEVEVKSVGGISAPIVALELSGLAPTPFHFHGFFARDKSKKNKDIDNIKASYGTHIFFEGVSRVLKTLDELTLRYPELEFAVARELTKEYETVYRFKGIEFASIRSGIVEKGEFVILVNNPHKEVNNINEEIMTLANKILEVGAKPKLVAKLISEITGENSKSIYSSMKDK